MTEFESAIPKKEQELKSRTDEAIRDVGALPDEEMGQVAGGSDWCDAQADNCTEMSKYACKLLQCDTSSVYDCASDHYHQCVSDHD